jgi:hypothetical protein
MASTPLVIPHPPDDPNVEWKPVAPTGATAGRGTGWEPSPPGSMFGMPTLAQLKEMLREQFPLAAKALEAGYPIDQVIGTGILDQAPTAGMALGGAAGSELGPVGTVWGAGWGWGAGKGLQQTILNLAHPASAVRAGGPRPPVTQQITETLGGVPYAMRDAAMAEMALRSGLAAYGMAKPLVLRMATGAPAPPPRPTPGVGGFGELPAITINPADTMPGPGRATWMQGGMGPDLGPMGDRNYARAWRNYVRQTAAANAGDAARVDNAAANWESVNEAAAINQANAQGTTDRNTASQRGALAQTASDRRTRARANFDARQEASRLTEGDRAASSDLAAEAQDRAAAEQFKERERARAATFQQEQNAIADAQAQTAQKQADQNQIIGPLRQIMRPTGLVRAGVQPRELWLPDRNQVGGWSRWNVADAEPIPTIERAALEEEASQNALLTQVGVPPTVPDVAPAPVLGERPAPTPVARIPPPPLAREPWQEPPPAPTIPDRDLGPAHVAPLTLPAPQNPPAFHEPAPEPGLMDLIRNVVLRSMAGRFKF